MGATEDYNEAIKLNADYSYAYLNRGITKEMLNDDVGSCADWTKASSLGVKSAAEYIKNQCK